MNVVRASDMTLTEADEANAAALFGISGVRLIGGYENALYRPIDPVGRILRITHTSRRSPAMIDAEFDSCSHVSATSLYTASGELLVFGVAR